MGGDGMKSRMLLICMVGLLIGNVYAYNPYAPNQFDVVEHNSWEYKVSQQVSKSGIAPEMAFKFNDSYRLTRFELVQFVAVAIQRRERVSESVQRLIDSLQKKLDHELQYVTPYKHNEEGK